jgi:hypothetical protein
MLHDRPSSRRDRPQQQYENMSSIDRRGIIRTGLALSVGAVAGCAPPAAARNDPSDAIQNVAQQISKLSEANEPRPSEIIFSGTPESVGPLVRGDVIDRHIDGVPA